MSEPASKAVVRLPPISDEQMTPAQRAAMAELLRTPRGKTALEGPFPPMLHSPELLGRAQRVGEYLRYAGAIPPKLREFAILITARHWTQRYEWSVHAPIALDAGLSVDIVDALAAGRRPTRMDAQETAVFEFCTQLHRTHAVDDATYAAAHDLLGDPGLVDLCGICGYYAMLAMVMNVARTPLPEGRQAPF